MAERRMFAKSVVLSDAFLDMPIGTRCLYFTLCMNADDDGFVNCAKSVMRQTGASIDDLNVLLARQFLIGFDNGLVVVRHWHCNNYIRSDRRHDTTYVKELMSLKVDKNGTYIRQCGMGTEEPLEITPESDLPIGKEKNTPPLLPCQPDDNRVPDTEQPSIVKNSQINGNQDKCFPVPEQTDDTPNERSIEEGIMKTTHYETPFERFCRSNNPKDNTDRSPYGIYQNVMLSDEEYRDLQNRYGSAIEGCIDRLSNGMKNKGYRYHHHYTTLITWMEEDKKKVQTRESFREKDNRDYIISSFDPDEFFETALRASYKKCLEECGITESEDKSEESDK